MKKAPFFTFLLLVFFIHAFAKAGDTGCNKHNDKDASILTHSYAYTFTGEGHQPAVLAVPDCCVPPASNTNKGLQKILGFNEIYFPGLNYNLSGYAQPIVVCNFLHQKRYLFYIFPSHNFW